MNKPKSIYTQSKQSVKELGLKIGDRVWACAFEYSSKKEGFTLRCEPVRGWLTRSNSQNGEARFQKNPFTAEPGYFVPEKVNSLAGDLSWSKAVMASSRVYFPDYESCKQGYNQMVEEWAQYFESQAEECESYVI